MVVGRDEWGVDDLEHQIRARGKGILRVYSQEMLLAALSTGDDPFGSASHDVLERDELALNRRGIPKGSIF